MARHDLALGDTGAVWAYGVIGPLIGGGIAAVFASVGYYFLLDSYPLTIALVVAHAAALQPYRELDRPLLVLLVIAVFAQVPNEIELLVLLPPLVWWAGMAIRPKGHDRPAVITLVARTVIPFVFFISLAIMYGDNIEDMLGLFGLINLWYVHTF